MSTISTSMASRVAAEHERRGQGYVAAPVFGNPEAAKSRQLFVVAAGATSDVERCQPLFDVLGQKTFAIGTEPWQANLIKLLGNMMTATALEMLGGLDCRSWPRRFCLNLLSAPHSMSVCWRDCLRIGPFLAARCTG